MSFFASPLCYVKCLYVQERRLYLTTEFEVGYDVRQVESQFGSQSATQVEPWWGWTVDVVVVSGPEPVSLPDEGAIPAVGVR